VTLDGREGKTPPHPKEGEAERSRVRKKESRSCVYDGREGEEEKERREEGGEKYVYSSPPLFCVKEETPFNTIRRPGAVILTSSRSKEKATTKTKPTHTQKELNIYIYT
jgi:hypothetical protein